ITGDETPFDVPIDGSGSGIGKALTGFGPESSGMVLVAETRTSGNWMNPQFDVTFDQAKTGITGYRSTGMNSHLPPDNAIGSYHTVGVNVGLRNGGVSFISETINLELWERVLTGKERMKW
ncbi:MAG: DUF1559 domain-containing protein, partial [Planctomycetaceae bacterium]|nr:DUF1559 domain-containing protein [Planctomycetaceae bacterium]